MAVLLVLFFYQTALTDDIVKDLEPFFLALKSSLLCLLLPGVWKFDEREVRLWKRRRGWETDEKRGDGAWDQWWRWSIGDRKGVWKVNGKELARWLWVIWKMKGCEFGFGGDEVSWGWMRCVDEEKLMEERRWEGKRQRRLEWSERAGGGDEEKLSVRLMRAGMLVMERRSEGGKGCLSLIIS